MLRRVERTELAESWVLVPQIEHARLSGGLAETWAGKGLAAIEPHDEFIEAIGIHDDGWAEWDAAPDVDPASGRPLSFVEMPLEAAIAIWRRSIDLATEQGPLAAHVISAHFNALLQQSSPRWSADPQRYQVSRDFFNEQSEKREILFTQWQGENPTVRTRKMVDQALAYLQFFDRLSLWLCAAPRRDPQSFATPQGTELMLQPTGPNRFTVSPWPLTVDQLIWTMTTRRIPAGFYASRAAVAAMPGEATELRFKLRPAP